MSYIQFYKINNYIILILMIINNNNNKLMKNSMNPLMMISRRVLIMKIIKVNKNLKYKNKILLKNINSA